MSAFSIALRYSDAMPQRQTSPDVPYLWLLSDRRNDATLENTLAALPAGSGFVFRHYHLADAERRKRFVDLAKIARRHRHLVVLSRAQGWGEDGYYGTSPLSSEGRWFATARDRAEIAAAARLGAAAIFLSPVYATASHPGAATLGPERFHDLAKASPIPIIALGGMTAQRARDLGWPRWGAIDGLSPSNLP